MSKNEQMHSVIGPGRGTTGAARPAQGVYGSRGNLELVACDDADGLWVFWFNSDHDSDPVAAPDVPPGTWSAGLHFAAGDRYTEAQILQSPLGPDHLEVLALDDGGTLQSWYWSPGPGFARRAADAATDVTRFTTSIASDGTLTVDYVDLGFAHRRAMSGTADYPERSWTVQSSESEPQYDADAEVAAAGIRSLLPGTARAATSTRDGGMRELTWRDVDGTLRHVAVPLTH